jgi:hypothetical protein
MTERGLPIADGAPACPFVAFEDDRDERATSPDHRHRCYAEPNPAPRALAHQEAYCLSSAFPVCPTFQDWARREAARSRGEGPRPSESAAAAIAAEPPQRNPPRNWAAPPPWAGRGGPPGSGAQGLWGDPDEEHDDRFEDDVPGYRGSQARPVQGLSGSYADRMAGDASGRVPAAGPAHAPEVEDEPEEPVHESVPPPRRREREPGRYPAMAGAGPAASAPDRRPERHRDAAAPEWERMRPQEAYPTLRARSLPSLSVPPLLVAVIALALAAAVLFALPGLLGFGNPSAQATPTPTPRPTALASLPPTPVPAPTQQVYIVQQGDTMSRIATRFGIPLGDLIAANAETIPDPDKLQIGDQVIIPVALPTSIPAAT